MEAGMTASPARQHHARYATVALFEPDTVVPAQWYGLRRRNLTGEQRLMLAVLEDAIDTILRPVAIRNASDRTLRHDALAWLRSNDRAWLFGFLNVCDVLGYDPDYLRGGVQARLDARVVVPLAPVRAPVVAVDQRRLGGRVRPDARL